MNRSKYKMSSKEIIRHIMEAVIISLVLSFLFYDSLVASALFMLFLPFYMKKQQIAYLERSRYELGGQFIEMIDSLETAISAGSSVEKAFYIVKEDMAKLYSEQSMIFKEIDEIVKGVEVNIPISECMKELSDNAYDEDIGNFAEIFIEAISTGGDLSEIIRNTASIMREKRSIEEEIRAMLKGKILEQRIMSLIPLLIFAYLRISNGDFMKVLYHNTLGIIAMSVCLILYVSSYLASEKIVRIKV